MLEALEARWSGERWRLWSFVAGIAVVPAAVLLAFMVAVATGERLVPLVLLLLVVLILAGSLVGSGIIDTLSSQLNRGGLARETTDDVDRALETGDKDKAPNMEQEQDRRTIRSGLFIIGPIVAFVYFMTVI